MQSCNKTKIAYIDSTSLAVCHNKRRSRNKTFRGVAASSKTTKGWFYGLKLHLVIDDKGHITSYMYTSGNVDDRAPVPNLVRHLKGLLLGDRGYLSKNLFSKLLEKGVKLITGIKKNMLNKPMLLQEKLLLRKRGIIESVFNVLKNRFDLEHTRHRSIANACIHFISILISYCLKQSKPSIIMHFNVS